MIINAVVPYTGLITCQPETDINKKTHSRTLFLESAPIAYLS